MPPLLISAAHAGVSPGAVPIGGGATVVGQLAQHWAAAGHEVTVLGLGRTFPVPGVQYECLPVRWPRGRGPDDLVRLSELEYARICRDFELAATDRILAHPARDRAVVVANDISEGPDFARLAAAGVPVVTLWHVDVVDYFCRFYLRGCDPAWALRQAGRLGSRLPDVLKLVFTKQTACVRHCARHVVPSGPMRDVIEHCYPGAGQRVEVVPWGSWQVPMPAAETAAALAQLRTDYDLRAGETVLVTVSRLSPEKGLERLLAALAVGERLGQMPAGVRLLIGGEAAYMQGARYRRRLERDAARLHQARVSFLGYVSGARKAALWQLADLYVFPSRHESYGLTLAEALRAGVPVVSTAHYSAATLVPRDGGVMVANAPERDVPGALWRALRPLLSDPLRRGQMAAAAADAGGRLDFAQAAARVADVARWAGERRARTISAAS